MASDRPFTVGTKKGAFPLTSGGSRSEASEAFKVGAVRFLGAEIFLVVQDPHCLTLHPANPDRLYQQNHCGIYRIDCPGARN
jgi:hypothetical protein